MNEPTAVSQQKAMTFIDSSKELLSSNIVSADFTKMKTMKSSVKLKSLSTKLYLTTLTKSHFAVRSREYLISWLDLITSNF